MPTVQDDGILASLKRAAAVLREQEIPFALGGGLAAWARGGPPTEHDIDLLIREEDAERALDALRTAGLRTEHPPEGWLVKAWDGPILIDLIYRPSGLHVDDELLARCEEMSVHAVTMRVMPVEDLLATKLTALTEHNLDFGPVLEHARALREQVDWERLTERVGDSPFARAFLYLAGLLGISNESAPVP